MRNTLSAPPRVAVRRESRRREHLQALTRGLQALALMNRVGAASNGLLAKRLGLKYSTAHRILMVLSDQGLVRHEKLGHQFVVAGGVQDLSNGLRDVPFVEEIALPRMQAWTQRHGLPLLLVAESDGVLTVRASTDANWPVAGERCLAGNILTAAGSSEQTIFRAFGSAEPDGATARAARRLGFARTRAGEQGDLHVSVPILAADGLIACLSIRCDCSIIGRRGSVRRWAGLLRSLADEIAAAR